MKVGKPIVAAATVGAVLSLAAAVMLWREIQSFRKAEHDLRATRANLESFYRRDPFPSPDNVQTEKSNLERLETWRSTLTKELRKGGIQVADTTGVIFIEQFFATRRNLIAIAERSKTRLVGDDKFAFGFDEYMTGENPADEHAGRLTEQLQTIDILCRMLFEENVHAIARIDRETSERSKRVRERPTRSASAQAARPADEPTEALDAFREKTRYSLEFTAREESLMRFLNRLASHETFIAVATLELRYHSSTPESGLRPPKIPGPTSSEERKEIPLHMHPDHQHRLVAGRAFDNMLQVKIELDVYRFKGDV